MIKDEKIELSGGGLELDTLDGFTIPTVKSVKQTPRTPQELDSGQEKNRSDRKFLYVGPAIAVFLLVLLTVLAFQYARQDLSLSFQGGSRGGTSEHYLRVGPVSATLPNSDIVKLSVDIGCRNKSDRKRLAEKDSLLRNQIVSVLTEPETGSLFEDQRYDEVKAKIKKGLEQIGEKPVGEIYFSELRVF